MPTRINRQRAAHGARGIDESSAGAPYMASLIFHSLAASYAEIFEQIEGIAGKAIHRIYMIGGGSRNAFLRELTAKATGKQVLAGSPESSTVGNFALQLAALTRAGGADMKRQLTRRFAQTICEYDQNRSGRNGPSA